MEWYQTTHVGREHNNAQTSGQKENPQRRQNARLAGQSIETLIMAVLSTIVLAPSKYRLSFRSWSQKPIENLPACPFIIFIQRVPSTAVEDST